MEVIYVGYVKTSYVSSPSRLKIEDHGSVHELQSTYSKTLSDLLLSIANSFQVQGQACASGNWIQAYANYLTQYVRDYKQEGVNISHIGFLNEPDASFSYDSMRSDGTQAAQVITVLRATLDTAGYTDTKILCCDGEGWGVSGTMVSQMKAANVFSKLGAVSSHGYTAAPGSPFDTTLPVWQTEYVTFSLVILQLYSRFQKENE